MADANEGLFDKIKGVFEGDGKANDVLDNIKGSAKDEAMTDEVLDKVADAAKKVTGGKFDEQIEKARDEADKHLGSE